LFLKTVTTKLGQLGGIAPCPLNTHGSDQWRYAAGLWETGPHILTCWKIIFLSKKIILEKALAGSVFSVTLGFTNSVWTEQTSKVLSECFYSLLWYLFVTFYRSFYLYLLPY